MLAIASAVVLMSFFVWEHGRNRDWWGMSDAQKALLSDPMAAQELDGLSLARQEVSKPAGITGKSPGPFVRHWFDPQGEAGAAKARLIKVAQAQGWKHDATRSDSISWLAFKQTPHGTAVLVIAVDGPPGPEFGEGMAGNIRVFLTYA